MIPLFLMQPLLVSQVTLTCAQGTEMASRAMLSTSLSNYEINEVIAEFQSVVPEECLLPTLRTN